MQAYEPAQYARTCQKWIVRRLWSHFGPEEHWRCEVLLMCRMSSSMSWSSLCLKGEVTLGSNSWLKADWPVGQGHGKSKIGEVVIRKTWERIFWTLQNKSLRMIWTTWMSLWMKFSLPSQAQHLLSAVVNKMAIVTGLELCLGSPSHCWVFWLQAVVTNPESPGGSANHLEASWSHWSFQIIEGIVICPLWSILTVDLDLLSLLAVLLSAPPSGDLQNASYHVIVSDTIPLLTKKLTLQWMKQYRGLMSMESIGLIVYSITKKHLVLLKPWLWCLLGDNNPFWCCPMGCSIRFELVSNIWHSLFLFLYCCLTTPKPSDLK